MELLELEAEASQMIGRTGLRIAITAAQYLKACSFVIGAIRLLAAIPIIFFWGLTTTTSKTW
jgi:hypothetical protein